MNKAAVSESKPKQKDVQFFAMPLWRLYVLTVVTGGLYQLYWDYKNWKAIREADKTYIMPFWRALFSVIFIWPLYLRIARNARSRGYTGFSALLWLAALLVILVIAGNYGSFALPSAPLYGFLYLAYSLLLPLVLLPVQRAINHGQEFMVGIPGRRWWSKWEIIVLIVGVALMVTTVYSWFAYDEEPIMDVFSGLNEEVDTAFNRTEELLAEYDHCSDELLLREQSLDTMDEAAVEAYNADWDACEEIRHQQNKAVDDYNALIGR